jgi:hypothetical protein
MLSIRVHNAFHKIPLVPQTGGEKSGRHQGLGQWLIHLDAHDTTKRVTYKIQNTIPVVLAHIRLEVEDACP